MTNNDPELTSDAKLEAAVPTPTRAGAAKSTSSSNQDDRWAVICRFCQTMATAGGPEPNTCQCGKTQINQAGQVFTLRDDYWESQPSEVVRTVAEFVKLRENVHLQE